MECSKPSHTVRTIEESLNKRPVKDWGEGTPHSPLKEVLDQAMK